jgi:simple sugar transport system permease protein
VKKLAPMIATVVVCAILLGACGWRYGHDFLSLYNLTNLLNDGAYLGVIAVGSTFVILTGGIDLSVGSIMGLTTIIVATLVTKHGMHPALAIPIALGIGAVIGFVMGCVIQFFELAPFLVTLGGLFFARGLTFLISVEGIEISSKVSPAYGKLSEMGYEFHIGQQTGYLSGSTIVFLAVVVIGTVVAYWTRFGRNVYAIGGGESSASLMGVPVGRVKIMVYTLSGFCAALGGVLNTMYKLSGDPNAGTGLELDAISAVVIGGTLLTGGVGYVPGTLLGVLILGIIQSAITYENLISWWARIAIGVLLFVFILLQKVLTGTTGLRRQLQK